MKGLFLKLKHGLIIISIVMITVGCSNLKQANESSEVASPTNQSSANVKDSEANLTVPEKITLLIKEGKYEDAKQLFPSELNEDLMDLYNVNNALICDKGFKSVCAASYLIELMNYQGGFKGKVDELTEKYKDDMIYLNTKSKKSGDSSYIEISPYIGMSKEDLYGFSWGEPADINKTTTKYGVSEQWVYSGGRYVYLDDGVVTGIQE